MRVDIQIPRVVLARKLAGIGKVTPKAMVKALNSLAYESRQEVVTNLDRSFVVRKRGFLVRGIRYTKATTADLTAAVGTIDRFLAEQDINYGVDARQGKDGKMRGVPIEARPQKTDITPRSKWPGAFARRSGYFFQTTKGKIGLYHRLTKARYPIKLVYRMQTETRIPQEWPMIGQIIGEADANFLDKMTEEFDRAIGATR